MIKWFFIIKIMELVCTVSSCKQVFEESKSLLKHLKEHIKDRFHVLCPEKKRIN